jgi:IS5 family transposase
MFVGFILASQGSGNHLYIGKTLGKVEKDMHAAGSLVDRLDSQIAIVRIAGNDPDRARIHFLVVEVEDWLAARKSMNGGKASRQGCRKPRPSLERMVAELTARVAKLEAGA